VPFRFAKDEVAEPPFPPLPPRKLKGWVYILIGGGSLAGPPTCRDRDMRSAVYGSCSRSRVTHTLVAPVTDLSTSVVLTIAWSRPGGFAYSRPCSQASLSTNGIRTNPDNASWSAYRPTTGVR